LETIKILIPTHTTPGGTSVVTLLFENLLPVLKKYVDVHIIWLIYQPDRMNKLQKISDDETILDIHDYDDAIKLLNKHKPDIIFASATRAFIDYALSLAARSLEIPIFSMFWSDSYYGTASSLNYLKHNINRFFQNSIPTDTDQNKKQRMRRGKFFIFKYLFLLKTQITIKFSIFQIINSFFILLKQILLDSGYDPRFSTSIHFLEDKIQKKFLIKLNFEESTLFVTGNPIYDQALQKSFKQKNISNNSDKKKILFVTSTFYEHGFWTKEQRDFTIRESIKQIYKKNDELSVTVKIHPSTSILSEYTSIINQIDSSILVYQKGGIQEFLENSDLEITTSYSSTAEVFAIIARKPIVICNFFNSEQDLLVKKGLAVECTDPSNLLESIQKASNILEYDKKRDDFIKEFFYKSDGRASERICNEILKLLLKK
jgi:UDP-N-acetylglucosamine:LPS N-acetylglucosamine transferase